MRMSCNGCRVLRKGCSDNCSIRPCLQWIKNPESQANATVFLAKFYGRAGLLNLINTGPAHLRPAIFRSLLYEACGRIVNPIYGSVGLLWSGSWQLCQAAVESILKGAPVAQIPADAATAPAPPLKPYDIRHISKGGGDLHKVARRRNRFKRSAANSSLKLIPDWAAMDKMDGANGENFGTVEASADTMEGSHVSQGEQGSSEIGEEEEEVGLELTLGLEPAAARQPRNAGVRCGFELEQETQKGGKFV